MLYDLGFASVAAHLCYMTWDLQVLLERFFRKNKKKRKKEVFLTAMRFCSLRGLIDNVQSAILDEMVRTFVNFIISKLAFFP